MMENLARRHQARSFSVSAENPTGAKGAGAQAEEGLGAAAARELGRGWKIAPALCVKSGQVLTLADYHGTGAIRHIWITFGGAAAARDLILRFYWDGSVRPSAEVPLGDFFATAQAENGSPETAGEFRQISSLAVCVNPKSGLNCYWEMPFRSGFRVTVENRAEQDAVIFYQIDGEEKELDADALYFHARFRRQNPLPYGEVYTILDGAEGGGQYVGTYLLWGVHQNGWWGEGEIKFYIDGDADGAPTICGTGTEDYFCGSYNFDVGGAYREYSTLYTGLSKVSPTDSTYKACRRFNMYRWHIRDPIYFDENLRVTIQALGWRSDGRYCPLQDDISSVAFWYSDRCDDVFPALGDRNALEII